MTFAVVLTYLVSIGVAYKSFVTVLLVVLEVPAIAVGIWIAKTRASEDKLNKGALLPLDDFPI